MAVAEMQGEEAGKQLLNTKHDVEHVRLALCESWSSPAVSSPPHP